MNKINVKEAIQDFKESLDKVDLLMYNTDEELLTSSMSDWWGAFLDSPVQKLLNDRIYCKSENETFINLLHKHTAWLEEWSSEAQHYIETESESDIWNHMVDFDNELYRILEEFELAIPKINAEITVSECGFEEDSVDKLEKMFKELIS